VFPIESWYGFYNITHCRAHNYDVINLRMLRLLRADDTTATVVESRYQHFSYCALIYANNSSRHLSRQVTVCNLTLPIHMLRGELMLLSKSYLALPYNLL
jgi:hypothetical protein